MLGGLDDEEPTSPVSSTQKSASIEKPAPSPTTGGSRVPPPIGVPPRRPGNVPAPAGALPPRTTPKPAPPITAKSEQPETTAKASPDTTNVPTVRQAPSLPNVVGRGPVLLGDTTEETPLKPAAPSPATQQPAYQPPPRRDLTAEPLDTTAVAPVVSSPVLSAAQPPVTPPPAETPPPAAKGARTYCRWCGMESDDPNVCSFCHKDLKAMPASSRPASNGANGKNSNGKGAGGHAPTQPPRQQTVSKQPAVATGVQTAAPTFGTFQAEHSKYYTNQMVDPVSGAHYDGRTGEAIPLDDIVIVTESVNLPRQLGIYLVLLAVMTGVLVALGSIVPTWYLALLGVGNFVAGLLMPVLRVVPFGEDDSGDVAIAFVLMLLFGPFAGAMIYGIVCVMKQDANPAIVGIFISSLVVRAALDLATGHSLANMVPFKDPTVMGFAAQLMTLVAVAGWYAAAPFHKDDE